MRRVRGSGRVRAVAAGGAAGRSRSRSRPAPWVSERVRGRVGAGGWVSTGGLRPGGVGVRGQRPFFGGAAPPGAAAASGARRPAPPAAAAGVSRGSAVDASALQPGPCGCSVRGAGSRLGQSRALGPRHPRVRPARIASPRGERRGRGMLVRRREGCRRRPCGRLPRRQYCAPARLCPGCTYRFASLPTPGGLRIVGDLAVPFGRGWCRRVPSVTPPRLCCRAETSACGAAGD